MVAQVSGRVDLDQVADRARTVDHHLSLVQDPAMHGSPALLIVEQPHGAAQIFEEHALGIAEVRIGQEGDARLVAT